MSDLREYFDKLAPKRAAIRKRHSYYWDDITFFCNYFSNESLKVLEVGCGTGELIGNIKGHDKVGIDFSPEMISRASASFKDVTFKVMNAENIEIPEKFDLVILSNLIGFTSDVQKVFEQLHAICHDQTKIIVTYYNHLWEPVLKLGEMMGIKKKTPNQNWLTQNDIRNLLMLAGFDVYRESKRMLFPIYIPVISWFFNKILAKLPIIRSFAINNYSFAKPIINRTHEEFKDKYSVSIVIPARNESGNIESGLLRIPSFGKSQEVIFVEGNSTDDTWETIISVADKYKGKKNIKVAKQSGKGKNDAVKKGFEIATGDILMILDADLTVAPEDLPKFYNAIASGKGDFVNGCRLVYPMEKEAMRFLNMLGNKFFSIAFSWLLEQPFKDTLCGTKVIFRHDYINLVKNRKFFGDFDPFGDYDLLFGAFKLNLKIVELPIRYRERTYGTTNISRFKHGLILLKMCFFAARKIKFI
jgi:ubiquinone/menaquinone biosynthesis C-methylase UbiE